MARSIESVARRSGAYPTGVGVAVVTSFLTVWTTIVRDDGTGASYFMVILAVGVGWFAARFQPAGMARTMVGIAVMQLLLGMLIATAPITATAPDGVLKAIAYSAFFAFLWLISANFFRIAAKGDRAAEH
jgi:hypothetical protein